MDEIVFNPFKHHLHNIYETICKYAEIGESQETTLIEEVGEGKGIADIYVGKLSPEEILAEVHEFLAKNDLLSPEKYRKYLESEGQIKRMGHYTSIRLSDGTEMTLRMGEDLTKYVHIHPSRYSPNTFRIRTNTLRTVIFVYFLSKCRNIPPDDISLMTVARHKLNLSPVPEIPSAIQELMEKLRAYEKH